MVKRPLIYLLASYILGVLCYYYGSISICILMFLLITFLVFLYFKYSAKVTKKAHLHYFDESKVFIFVPCCYLLGIFFMMYEMQPTKFEELLMNRKESGVVQGKIEEIWRTENGMKLEISDVTVKFVDRNQEETLKYNLVIYDNSNQEYKLGNIVMWEGKISTFEPPGNYGQFDEVMYQKARGIEGVCFAKSGRVIDIHNNYLQNKIQDGKTKIQKVYKTLLNEEDYGIISAMLVGDKQDLSKEIKKLYQKQGMAHILSISGLHISMLGMGFFQILRKLKLKLSFATGLTIGFLFLYGMLTGFALSTIRAIIMLIIKLFATIFGKTYDSISAIAISALILLMKQPVRIFDSGFLLSYGAVFGVFCVSSALVQLINKEGGKIYIRIKEAFFMSLGIQLATLPIVLNFYYEVPLYAPIMNLILLPFMSLLVGQALIGGVIGCFSLTLGKFLLGGVHYQLLAMKNVMEYASKLPFATLILGKPAKVQIILYYSILLSILGVVWCIITIRKEDKEAEGIWDSFRMIKGTVKSQHVVKEKYLMQQQQKNMTSMVETTYLHMKPYFYPVLKKLDYYSPKLSDVMLRISRRKRLDEIVIALCVCLGIILASRPIKGLRVTMLDVGQGESICLEEESGITILVDAGSSSISMVGTYRILPYLKARGHKALDYLILTHMDEDHINGVKELYEEEYPIQHLIVSKVVEQEDSFIELLDYAKQYHTQIHYFQTGDRLQFGTLQLECLNPCADGNVSLVNENSLAFGVKYGNSNLLLTGDVEGAGENNMIQALSRSWNQKSTENLKKEKNSKESEDLLEQSSNHINVLKVGHHGSKNATTDELLDLINPKVAIISCGKDNRYHHPHVEVLERLQARNITYEVTEQHGAITLQFDGKKIKMSVFKKNDNKKCSI